MATSAGSQMAAERRRRRDRTRWGPDDVAGPAEPVGPAENHCTATDSVVLPAALQPAPPVRRPKRSRWASEDTDAKAVVPGLTMPVSLPPSLAGLVDANPQAMLLHRRLSAISQRLSELSAPGHIVILPEEQRSPSPEPQYSEHGVRLNTRTQRLKERLTAQAQEVVTQLLKVSPGFKPPPEFRPAKRQRKIFVPTQQYPGYNFIGLIIGPRGNTQKRMQQESGAKIALRGKGSVKDGRGGRNAFDPSEDEELHVLITADAEESLDKASDMVQQLMVPLEEGVNEHKRMQLRELAELNGTLRESELQELHGQGQAPGAFQLPPAVQEAVNRQYDRDMAAAHPHQEHESLDHAYHDFLQELSQGPAPWGGRSQEQPSGHQPGSLRNRDDSSPCNLFVGCIPAGMDEISLRALFEPSGQIAECHLVLDRGSGQHRGFGFVRMAHEQGAANAMERLHNLALGGRSLVVRQKHGSQPLGNEPLTAAPSLPSALGDDGQLPSPPQAGNSDQLPPPQMPAPSQAPSFHLQLPPAPLQASTPAPAADRPPGVEEEPADKEEVPKGRADDLYEFAILSQAPSSEAYPHSDSGFVHPLPLASHGFPYPPYSHPADHPESLAVAAHHAQVHMPGYSMDQQYSMLQPAEQPHPGPYFGQPLYGQPYLAADAARQPYPAHDAQQQYAQPSDDDLRPPGADGPEELCPPGADPPAELTLPEQQQQPGDWAAQQQAPAHAEPLEEDASRAPGTEDGGMPPPPPPPPELPIKAVQVVKVPLPLLSAPPATPAEELKIVPPTVKLRIPKRVAERAAQQRQEREKQQAQAPAASDAARSDQAGVSAAAADSSHLGDRTSLGAAAALRQLPAPSPLPPAPRAEDRRSSQASRKLRRKARSSPSPTPRPAPALSPSPAPERTVQGPKGKARDRDRKRSKRSRKSTPARGGSKLRLQRHTASPSSTPEDLGQLEPAAPVAQRGQARADAVAKNSSEDRSRGASPRKRRQSTRWRASSPVAAMPDTQPTEAAAGAAGPASPELLEEGEIPMEEGQSPSRDLQARSPSPASARLPSPSRCMQPHHAAPLSPRSLDTRRRPSGLLQGRAELQPFARRMDNSRRMTQAEHRRERSPVAGSHRRSLTIPLSIWADDKPSGAYGPGRAPFFDEIGADRLALPLPPQRRALGSERQAGFVTEQSSTRHQGWGGLHRAVAGHPQQQPAVVGRGMASSGPYGVYGMPMADMAMPVLAAPGMTVGPKGMAQWPGAL